MQGPEARAIDRYLGIALSVLALAGILVVARNLDWALTWRALSHLGARAPLVAVPYFFVLACDTYGWRNTFEDAGPLGFWRLWCVRLGTEAVSNSMPAGPALAETVKAVILQRRFGLTLAAAGANVVIAKFAIAISQAVFLIAALVFVAPELHANSHAVLGHEGLEWIAFGVALGFFLVVTLALWAVARGQLFTRLLGSPRLRRFERLQPAAARLDHAFGSIARMPRRRTLRAIGWFFVGWLCLGLENYVILSLLSSDVSLAQALSMEALLSIVRILFFFLPSALGAQEAGYYLVLRAYGMPEPEVMAAAFMVAKRLKELSWVVSGYVMLSSLNTRLPVPAVKAPS